MFRSLRERESYLYLTAVCLQAGASHPPGLGRVTASARERGGLLEGHGPLRLDEVKCALLSPAELGPDAPLGNDC